MNGEDASPLYQRLADKLSSDIQSGALPLGAQLPTQRNFAAEMGTTVGTIGRAYTLLEKRGLIVRAVGRGTYVGKSSPGSAASSAPLEKASILKKISEMETQLVILREMVKRL